MIQTTNWLLSRTAGLFALLAFSLLLLVPEFPGPTYYYFRTQDLPLALLVLALLALAAYGWPRLRIPDLAPSSGGVLGLAALLVTALWAGTHWLLFDYPLTRDEHMVIFDAQIFATGKLAQPLATEWQEYAHALVPDWSLEVPGDAVLASFYLPGNAIMRTGFEYIADPAMMNPILWAIGFFALYDIACRLFMHSPSAIWVVLATYLLSAQVLLNAMTSYAMTGHLALNLVWLALFLRGKPWQHAFVMVIGAWLIGLHQISYHPLLAAPFILMLLQQRRWLLFAAYVAVYTLAILFWFSYPSIAVWSLGIETTGDAATGIIGYLGRIWSRLITIDLARSALMEFNVLRFLVWTPLFVLPLVMLAWPDIRRMDRVAFPLFLGIALMLLMRTVLLPYQGHGWGYRSLHGLIGNFAILAGYGYVQWAKYERERADGTVALLGGVAALIVIPFLLWSAHQFTAPYTRLSAAIERQTTDFVVVDTDSNRDARDQVRNRADLANRPLVFASSKLSNAQLAELCSRGSVTWVGASDIAAAELPMRAGLSPETSFLEPPRFKDCLRPFDRSVGR